ncbi:MAG: hypothetical protein BWY26_00401 [Elusimicrobia bacterium ADurb.Bin231]|nr:MAG: hypothetical protein BWY26_00401 [Elusimicrobia bacterium ADurb.Bin231]
MPTAVVIAVPSKKLILETALIVETFKVPDIVSPLLFMRVPVDTETAEISLRKEAVLIPRV